MEAHISQELACEQAFGRAGNWGEGNGKHLVLGCIGEDILMRQRILHSLVLAPRHICQVRSRDYFSVSLAFQTCKSQQVNKPTADTFYTVADSTASY